MLNLTKFIEILISIQSILISTMIPVYIAIPFTDKFNSILEFPITWQIPTIIIITLIFKSKVVIRAFTIYLILGLFIVPIFHQGGSLGYILTPNFGYLLGIFPLIKIIDNSNKREKVSTFDFLKKGIIGISSMHITGILLNFTQIIYYKQLNIFFYNVGNYSLGKIGYHYIMLLPLTFLIKPINFLKYRYYKY